MDNVNRDYYDVIGVPRNADPKQIKEAYNWLAEKYRPEHNAGNLLAAKNLALIEEAYETLGNPARRAAYDINLWSPREEANSSAFKKVAGTGRTTRSCPLCGEEILIVAKKCKHCGSVLDGSTPSTKGIMKKMVIGVCVMLAVFMALAYFNRSVEEAKMREVGYVMPCSELAANASFWDRIVKAEKIAAYARQVHKEGGCRY